MPITKSFEERVKSFRESDIGKRFLEFRETLVGKDYLAYEQRKAMGGIEKLLMMTVEKAKKAEAILSEVTEGVLD
jgi:hypothetical protein